MNILATSKVSGDILVILEVLELFFHLRGFVGIFGHFEVSRLF